MFFAQASVCVWRMLTLVRESCDPCLKLREFIVSPQSGLGGMMNHVYLQELQSGPSRVASSTHSVLG